MGDKDDIQTGSYGLPGKGKMKSEHVSISALVLTIIMGGGSLGLNFSSNKEVIAKIEMLTVTMGKFEEAGKATVERNAKLEAKVDKQQDVLDRLKDQVAALHESVHVLEAKLGVEGKK